MKGGAGMVKKCLAGIALASVMVWTGSAQDAKAELIRRMEEEAQADAANRIREIRESARRNAEREAKKIVALAIQRISSEQTAS